MGDIDKHETSDVCVAYIPRTRRVIGALRALTFIFTASMAVIMNSLSHWELGLPFDLYTIAIILSAVRESRVYIVGVVHGNEGVTIEYYQGRRLLRSVCQDHRKMKTKLYGPVRGSIVSPRLVLNCDAASSITQYSTGYWDNNTLTSLYESLRHRSKE
jgi:hypothetical protein